MRSHRDPGVRNRGFHFAAHWGNALIMSGFLGFAPIYVNGLLAIFFAFVLPGLVLVRALDVPNFPQRWLVIVLASLTANHLLVTLTAAFHLDPQQTFRAVAAALVVILLLMMARKPEAAGTPTYPGASVLLSTDVKWMAGTVIVLGFTYFNIWKHGVPNIFQGSDVSVSWNVWARIWSHGSFPTSSYGYPQFVPTTWGTTYIFTGSTEQYFAYYTYLVLIIVPIVLCMGILGRIRWRYAASLLLVFVWFVAEIREPWLRSTLQEGFPDWIAAIFGLCAAVLFVTNAPERGFDREKIVTALLSIWLLSIASVTKPIYGLLAIAVLIATCADAARYLQPRERNRLIIAAVGLLSTFVAAYAINYAHLDVQGMPNYPVAELSERLSRAARLLNSNFTIPYRILLLAGFVLSPFLPRVRWLALPMAIGFWLWANAASYDLRNVLGLLLITAFIPFHAVARRYTTLPSNPGERRWIVPDRTVALAIAALCVVLTLPLALSDAKLKQRFAEEQMSKGLGPEINQEVAQLLARGCTIFSDDVYINTIAAFERLRNQMKFYHFTEPLIDLMARQLNETTDCVSFLYPPDFTHPSILPLIDAAAKAQGLTKAVERNGMVILAPSGGAPAKN